MDSNKDLNKFVPADTGANAEPVVIPETLDNKERKRKREDEEEVTQSNEIPELEVVGVMPVVSANQVRVNHVPVLSRRRVYGPIDETLEAGDEDEGANEEGVVGGVEYEADDAGDNDKADGHYDGEDDVIPGNASDED